MNEQDATSGWDRFLALLVVLTFVLVIIAISGQAMGCMLLILMWGIVLVIPTVRNRLFQEYRTFIKADEGHSETTRTDSHPSEIVIPSVPLSLTPQPVPGRPTYTIQLPKDTVWQPAKATSLITQLI